MDAEVFDQSYGYFREALQENLDLLLEQIHVMAVESSAASDPGAAQFMAALGTVVATFATLSDIRPRPTN